MTNYINAKKLKELLYTKFKEFREKGYREDATYYYFSDGLDVALQLVDFLQKEQSEDVVSTANALLEALSKTPYNNKPITDAQIIVKQLLLFFENPKEYNPDAILEQPEVDLEKFDKDVTNIWGRCAAEPNDSIACFHIETFIEVARHFYELGLNARKEE